MALEDDRELPVTANFNWLVIYNYLAFNLPNKFWGYEIALAVSLFRARIVSESFIIDSLAFRSARF